MSTAQTRGGGNVETEREAPNTVEKRIEALARHQDQQKAFLDSMEGIRWKFVTAFGFGAGFALFSSQGQTGAGGPASHTLAGSVAIIISLTSIVAQIRIYALVHVLWNRIRCLQRAEAHLVSHLYGLSPALQAAFEFPHSAVEAGWLHHLLTVHMAICALAIS